MRKVALFMVVVSLTAIVHGNIADIDGSGAVDSADLIAFAAAWGSDDTPSVNWNPACDIASPPDGIIDASDFGVLSANWLWSIPLTNEITWVSIDDDGSGMKNGNGDPISHGGFTGDMSRYETSNAQYCQFLNDALASGDIYVDIDNNVYGANGSNGGGDFVDESYFQIYPAFSYSQITYSGGPAGTFTVRTRDTYDMSDHPAIMVSWYGATAFCNYYGYRLPTEWEWQAVADFDGTFIYGCGTSIDFTKANYGYDNPFAFSGYPYTSTVDYNIPYGYGMNDMAGNVWEWTSTVSGGYNITRGGCWSNNDNICTVSRQLFTYADSISHSIGFRVCR